MGSITFSVYVGDLVQGSTVNTLHGAYTFIHSNNDLVAVRLGGGVNGIEFRIDFVKVNVDLLQTVSCCEVYLTDDALLAQRSHAHTVS